MSAARGGCAPVALCIEDLRRIRARNVRSGSRASFRRPLQIIAAVNPGQPLGVTSYDLSPRGIGILSPRPWDPGQRFILALRRDNRTVLILASVVHCRRTSDDKGYRVGARFLEVLTQDRGRETLPLGWLNLRAGPDGLERAN